VTPPKPTQLEIDLAYLETLRYEIQLELGKKVLPIVEWLLPFADWIMARIDRLSPFKTDQAHPTVLPVLEGQAVDRDGVGGSRGEVVIQKGTPESTSRPCRPDPRLYDVEAARLAYELTLTDDRFGTPDLPEEWLFIVQVATRQRVLAMSSLRSAVSKGPHEFVGRLDRWCEVCDRPDRHPIHKEENR